MRTSVSCCFRRLNDLFLQFCGSKHTCHSYFNPLNTFFRYYYCLTHTQTHSHTHTYAHIHAHIHTRPLKEKEKREYNVTFKTMKNILLSKSIQSYRNVSHSIATLSELNLFYFFFYISFGNFHFRSLSVHPTINAYYYFFFSYTTFSEDSFHVMSVVVPKL